jgi:glutamate--cysteine ligase
MNQIESRLRALPVDRLAGLRRGIEKESLRARPRGGLAVTPHPAGLGAPLTHPNITTDYSESQLELITGVHASADACIDELTRLHQFVYREIDDEIMWVGSMPCGLPPDNEIPIAQYGVSNVGRAKSVYRVGLGYRYGRRMQTICGIHYNWSMPGVSSEAYFALIRNFRRHSFLLLQLFGASPAVCSSFLEGRQHGLQTLKGNTLGLPYATSLRMGRLGYQSDAQASLSVSYNTLDEYAASLHEALTHPYAAYEKIGLLGPDGEYRQMSTSLLQIENEFYGTIRPKRVIFQGERPLHALRERGVEYVEVRCMDLDPFETVGIGVSTLRFLDVFLLHCLLGDSPPDTPQEIRALARNQQRVAGRGREPGLQLERHGAEVAMADWGAELLRELVPIAQRVDALGDGHDHLDAVQAAQARWGELSTTPSARVLARMAEDFDESYIDFVRAQSARTREQLLALGLPDALRQQFEAASAASVQAQRQTEAGDSLPFEQYRLQYLQPERLGLPQRASQAV